MLESLVTEQSLRLMDIDDDDDGTFSLEPSSLLGMRGSWMCLLGEQVVCG